MLIVTNHATILGIAFISCFSRCTRRFEATQRFFTSRCVRREKPFEIQTSPLLPSLPAAVDGNFFKGFAKLHPTKNFPHVSLLVLCATGFVFSLLFKLSEVISAILAMRIVVQFIAQGVGLMLLRKREGTSHLPFKMWLYPVPVIISISIWIFLLLHNQFAIHGAAIAMIGVIVYLLINRNKKATIAGNSL